MAHYLNAKSVKAKFHDYNRQITKDGLHAIDIKVEQLIVKLCSTFNGHHHRVNSKIVELFKI